MGGYLYCHDGVAGHMAHLLHDTVGAPAEVADLHQVIGYHREGALVHRDGGLLVQIPWSRPKQGPYNIINPTVKSNYLSGSKIKLLQTSIT